MPPPLGCNAFAGVHAICGDGLPIRHAQSSAGGQPQDDRVRRHVPSSAQFRPSGAVTAAYPGRRPRPANIAENCHYLPCKCLSDLILRDYMAILSYERHIFSNVQKGDSHGGEAENAKGRIGAGQIPDRRGTAEITPVRSGTGRFGPRKCPKSVSDQSPASLRLQ